MTDIMVKKYPVTQLTITVFSFLFFLFNHYLIMCFLSAFVFSFTKIFVKRLRDAEFLVVSVVLSASLYIYVRVCLCMSDRQNYSVVKSVDCLVRTNLVRNI